MALARSVRFLPSLFCLAATSLATAQTRTTLISNLNLTNQFEIVYAGGARDMTASEIALFAPVVYLHPNEAYNPMDPLAFIRVARFRHHRGLQSDQGFHRETLSWVTTDSHLSVYYDMPMNVLRAYTLHANGQNRRPRDGNCGDSYNVFLETDGRHGGDPTPTADVPVFYTYQRSADRHKIQFWWFFGFNQTPIPIIGHQGDWEHVTVWVSAGKVQSVFFAAHEGGTTRTASQITMSGRRPVVFVALGTHAAYATSGIQHYPIGLGLSFLDATGYGTAWDTRQKLLPLATQHWKDYAGAWGSVGTLGTTTGPLGPWHKRNGQ